MYIVYRLPSAWYTVVAPGELPFFFPFALAWLARLLNLGYAVMKGQAKKIYTQKKKTSSTKNRGWCV